MPGVDRGTGEVPFPDRASPAGPISIVEERHLPDDIWWRPHRAAAAPMSCGPLPALRSWILRRAEQLDRALLPVADPRENSLVRRIVWEPFAVTADRLRALENGTVIGPLRLLSTPHEGVRRVDSQAFLALTRWCQRDVTVSVEQWSFDRCAFTLELARSGSRRRTSSYFDVAHDALTSLADRLAAPLLPGPRWRGTVAAGLVAGGSPGHSARS